jgi:protoheme IX farnesyltransferase
MARTSRVDDAANRGSRGIRPDVAASSPAPSKVADLLTLTKLRLNTLVVATTAGGYYMAALGRVDPVVLLNTCVGTALVAGGAAGVNQVYERDIDQLMDRTRLRPLADARMGVSQALAVSLVLALAGLALLWFGSSETASLVALATLLSYALVYTPLKRVTSLSTIVGAVPGALPPLIGWAASGGSLGKPAPWALFLIGFVWQLPHILAVSWMYREDYARARLPLLAVVDTTGATSGRQAVLWSAALIPVSLLPSTPAIHLTGLVYVIGALVLGVAQFVMAVGFARHRSAANARRLFYTTLIYLPLLWMLMVLGRW